MTKQRSDTTANAGPGPMTLMMVTLVFSHDEHAEEMALRLVECARHELGAPLSHTINAVAIPWTLYDAREELARYEPWVKARYAEWMKSLQ